MRFSLRRLLLAFVILVAVIQLARPARTNPPGNPDRAINATLAIDPAVAATFERSCNDCHSNTTVWPWYSNVAPVSWLVIYDVDKGRRKLNFSEWAAYNSQENQKLLDEICKEVSKGAMPGLPYSLLHPRARLTDADVQVICRWTQAALQKVPAQMGKTESLHGPERGRGLGSILQAGSLFWKNSLLIAAQPKGAKDLP